MKTITACELQRLIDGGPVELIDVRPRKHFEKIHAVTARSIPLCEFEPHSVVAHRKLDRRAPLYIMSQREMRASLAACSLSGAGLVDPIVVKGGLESWEKQHLPIAGSQSWRLPTLRALKSMLLSDIAAVLGNEAAA